jgi:Tir chaperone protein (CesT) family
MITPSTLALFAELAKELGLPELEPDASGGVQLTVGGQNAVYLWGQSDGFVLIAAPAAALPKEPDYAVVQWLLHRNFYDSKLAPFRIATDAGGTIVLWGRVPVDGLTGKALAGLVDAVAGEARVIRDEVQG